MDVESIPDEDGSTLSMNEFNKRRENERILVEEIDIRAGRDYVMKDNEEEILRVFQERILHEELRLSSSRNWP